jgi:hypothetical protein
LWKYIRVCQKYALDHDPISEATAVRAAVQNLEKTGVFTNAIQDWRKLGAVNHTMDQLKLLFNKADKERRRHLTTHDAGYAGAATQPATTPNLPPPVTPPAASPLSHLHYCWSHGLGPNRSHTSSTCRDKAPGHRDSSTVNNMLGGCNTIHRRRGKDNVFVNRFPPAAPP